jgi:NAD(P)-dependent dehydrogenase (short-subunit alcohol dehydrogenase family)
VTYAERMARILITGCSTGIGRASAVELARRGHEVIATARRVETLHDLDVSDRFALDVEDETSIAEVIGACGHIDGLVNNAGVGMGGPVESVPLTDVRRLFEVNFFGAVRMLQMVVPRMRHAGSGVIVNVSSVAGRVASPLGGFYAATKHALEAVSEALHFEVGHFGIRVVIIEPGFIDTNFASRVHHHGDDVPPYDELRRQWDQVGDSLLGDQGRPGPELVGTAIADAVENPDTPLRVPVGADAEMVTSTRASMDDATFEATMREVLGLSW